MTWKQFKEEVERNGVTDEMEIFYIDVNMPNRLHVCLPEKDSDDFGFTVAEG
jgi:hypothetical protein